MTEESAVKVCVRVRPFIEREETADSENAPPVQVFWKADKKSINLIDDGNSTKSFSFDRVFTADETTSQLYQDIAKPLVVSSVEGYNGTIFAYGQTSSGKTFTMMGSNHNPGVIPLAVEDVFHTIKNCPKKEFLLRVSYMEIYNETVTDLLVDSWKRKPLEVREALNKNVYVADLTEELVTSPAQALAWIRKGEKNRHYGKTKMNQRSSRSHTIFRMILESRERSDPASGENADSAIIVSHLNLVDLAGSERASQTGAEGARFKEGCNINRSLFTLGQVMKKLTDESQKGFTNYRDSKLTRILQNSLGGNAKTVIICTVTPVTLDETLGTLQFASTAKKMKNDPHVTEVSDDGALLKRYRNEIVDLKRRLHEVSSSTQTTAMEKEVLSQLLLEKDQLQREQQDRIKNLTKLLVTSSNLVSVHKMPKRRVTWGGKMLKLARPSAFGCGSSDLSFAEPFSRKRKADRSCLMELGDDDEEFDSHWEIPDEPLDDMEMSQSTVTVRSFQDSPKDYMYEERVRELSGKVSNLELQLDMESQQKEQATAKAEELDDQVAKLEVQLQTEVQRKQEAWEKIQTAEQRVAELELQLQTKVQEKQEVSEKVEMFEFRVADLETQLAEQSQAKGETDEQMRREFAEAVQLCETLASEKEMVLNEQRYLKQELNTYMEQIAGLEKESVALSRELKEKKELDEFKSLEEEIRKEQEIEKQNEMSNLKKLMESSDLQRLELQEKIERLSTQLKQKSDFADELQNMNGKDLVQEVAKLRRSLDDAEGLSRDTKKEWAVLRSQKISLEETVANLTASHEKMDAEVNSLRFQLETEKTRYKKMQSDLQKELNVAFDENTKLTSLLDGKVPKNLVDSVELERTVADLKKALTASCGAEAELRAQLDELNSLKGLPDTVDDLRKQVCEVTEQLHAAETQRDVLLSTTAQQQEDAQRLRDSLQTSEEEILTVRAELSSAALREKELSQQCADSSQQLDSLRSDLESSEAEKSQLMATAGNTRLKLEELEQHRASLEENVTEMQQMMKDLEEKLSDSETARVTEEEISKELQEKLDQLTEELQEAQAEKEQNAGEQRLEEENLAATERDQLRGELQEHLEMAAETQVLLQSLQDDLLEQRQKNCDLMDAFEQKNSDIRSLSQQLQCLQDEKESLSLDSAQSSTEELEKLLSAVASLTEERDQLKMDLQENVEMAIENQEELRTSLEKIRKQKELIKELQTGQTSIQDELPVETRAQLEELHTQMKALTEDLEIIKAERDLLLSEKEASHQTSTEEVEELLGRVKSLSEERDQLQEMLEGLRQEKQQLREEMEDRMEMVAMAHSGFNQLPSELQTHDETATFKLQQEIEELQASLLAVSEQKSQLEKDLQCNMDMASEAQTQLDSLQQQLQAQNQRNNEMERLNQERQTELEQQFAENQTLLRSLQEELQEQKQKNSDQMILCEQKERDLQQQTNSLTEQLQSAQTERDILLLEKTSHQTSTGEVEGLLGRVKSLSEERDQLQEMLEGLRQEKQQLHKEMEDRMETLQTETWDLSEKLEIIKAERDLLLSEKEASHQTSTEEVEELLGRVKSLSEERDQLEEMLEGLRQEKQQLHKEMEDRMETLHTETWDLSEKLEIIKTERDLLLSEKEASHQTSTEEAEELLGRVKSLSEERDQLQEMLEGLTQEKQQLHKKMEDRMETLQTETWDLSEKLEIIRAERNLLLSEKASHQTSTEEVEELLGRVKSLSEERDQLQEMLEGLRQEKLQLQKELEDRMETLQTEMWDLSEKLEIIKAERDLLLSEKEASHQTSTEEVEELLGRVKSLSEERDQLQEMLEGLRQEKQQLHKEMEDRMEMMSSMQEKLSEQTLNIQQAESREQEAKLQKQLLSDANETISALREQLSSLNQSASVVKETASSQLQDSAAQLQEMLRKFQHFKDTCSKYDWSVMDKAMSVERPINVTSLSSLKSYGAIRHLGDQAVITLGYIMEYLEVQARIYMKLLEELVKKDLAVFEERRLQDVLLCRAQAPPYSVKDEDFSRLWEQRLKELLDKRQLYLQKMPNILEKLWSNMSYLPGELSAVIRERERFKEQLQASLNTQPVNIAGLDSILTCELEHRAAVVQRMKTTLQDITGSHKGPCEELKLLEGQTYDQLEEERSKTSTLLQALEGGALKTELSLLNDNQQLVLKLQQTQQEVKALRIQNGQLEEAHITASDRVSNHKEATQLLQTELQDSRAEVEEKENVIRTLRTKLRESEEKTPPSAVELEKLKNKLFKMEVEMNSASDRHQQEVQRMKTLLSVKEDSLRKLKETLRTSQQQGEESFLQGEDLHARLTNPKGLMIKSTIGLEKTKLEEEVQQLKLKITSLESLVMSQQAEISKWKSRAIKLKVKNKTELDKPSPPSTPNKRGPPLTSDSSNFFSSPKKFLITPGKVLDSPRKVLDSPRKVLDSPNVSQLNSPKSRFFDVDGSSEVLSRTCPKQFFDNSSLGTIPEVSQVPETPEEETDAAGGSHTKDDWPQFPTEEDMCKTQ